MSMTDNEHAIVDEGTLSVHRTIQIAASADKVWAAITQPPLISQWFGRAEFDDAGVGTLTWDDHGSFPVRVEAADEPHAITYRWSNDGASGVIPSQLDEATSTTFTFTLTPVEGGTRLTVVETGFGATSDPLANLEDHRQGWNSELDELVALLEGAA